MITDKETCKKHLIDNKFDLWLDGEKSSCITFHDGDAGCSLEDLCRYTSSDGSEG